MADSRASAARPGSTGPGPLAILALVTLAVGAVASLALFGVAPLAELAAHWRRLFGLAALPAALAVTGAGAGLAWRRHDDPWHLPWGRALAVEAATAATLALLAVAFGPRAPDGPEGPGGLVGWALAQAASDAVGTVPATLAWLAVGTIGVLAALGVGAREIAAGLEALADALARAGPTARRPAAAAGASAAPTVSAGSVPPAAARPPTEPPQRAADEARRGGPATADRTDQGGRAGAPAGGRVAGSAGGPKIRPAAGPPKAAGPAPGARRPVSRPGQLPPPDLLGDERAGAVDDATLRTMAEVIERTLASFGVPAEVVEIERGPAVTQFGLRPGLIQRGGAPQRVKVARIVALKDDLALALAARSIRIEAPVPGRPLVGIEVPNAETHMVGLKGLLEDPLFKRARRASGLVLALGRDVAGRAVVADLGAMPHLLIAGATGSGKSVCINAVLSSLLFQNTPDALRLVLVDPKRVELARFGRLPHLVAPVVVDVAEVIGALRWLTGEMERRFRLFAERGVRDVGGFNARSPAGEAPLPAIVVVIDELADLMLTAPEETEPLVTRLAQLARATGIHLVLATQRPSTDVVTGVIKANFPARIAFAVASGVDSRVILDQTGAETLLGRGDMLYQAPDAARPRRVQGAHVTDDEIGELVAFWSESPWSPPGRTAPWDDLVTSLDPGEALYARAVELAGAGPVTASFLQRRLRVGYPKARELFERLTEEGLAGDGPADDLGWVDDEFGGP